MKNNSSIDYIVWDLETTGFVAPECKILEIGCFVVKDNKVKRMHWVLDNKVEIPENIIEITGITQDIIDDEGREPKECLLEFLPYFKRCKYNITHNGVRFDIPFLINYAEDVLNFTPKQKVSVTELIYSTAYDTAVYFKADKLVMLQDEMESYVQFAKKVMSMKVYGLKFNLGLVCDEMGIDRSNIVQHRATADVELTHEIYKKIKENE